VQSRVSGGPDPWLSSWVRRELRVYGDPEIGEPFKIIIDGKQGLAVDAEYTYDDTKITYREAIVVSGQSHLFFAFASVTDSPDGSRWKEEGKDAFNAILRSIRFFEPTDASHSLPCFTNHTSPELAVDFGVFENVRCPSNRYGFRNCEADSPLAVLGCSEIEEPSVLLGALEPSYPIAKCLLLEGEGRCESTAFNTGYRYRADGDCLYRVGGINMQPVGYVILRDEEFLLAATEDELRALYVPIASASEALSYVLAATGLRAHYGLAPDPTYTYYVDKLEDTHVETVEDGYLVHLYHSGTFGCGDHPISTVVFHITPQGNIKQVSTEEAFKDPAMDGMCID
jgi:hypothetical protein